MTKRKLTLRINEDTYYNLYPLTKKKQVSRFVEWLVERYMGENKKVL